MYATVLLEHFESLAACVRVPLLRGEQSFCRPKGDIASVDHVLVHCTKPSQTDSASYLTARLTCVHT